MRLIWAIMAIWAGVMMWAASMMLDNSRLVALTQIEIQAIRGQQEANARTIEYLIDQHWELKQQMRRANK